MLKNTAFSMSGSAKPNISFKLNTSRVVELEARKSYKHFVPFNQNTWVPSVLIKNLYIFFTFNPRVVLKIFKLNTKKIVLIKNLYILFKNVKHKLFIKHLFHAKKPLF